MAKETRGQEMNQIEEALKQLRANLDSHFKVIQ